VGSAFGSNPLPVPGTTVYTLTVDAASAEGSYGWLLTAAGPGQEHSAPITLTISAPATAPGLSWEPLLPAAGAPVRFTAEATGTAPLSLDWQFGDGGVGAGAVVTHTYAAPGAYTVVLTAGNRCGQDSIAADIEVARANYRVYLPLVLRGF
jgi:chitodextrinase